MDGCGRQLDQTSTGSQKPSTYNSGTPAGSLSFRHSSNVTPVAEVSTPGVFQHVGRFGAELIAMVAADGVETRSHDPSSSLGLV